jgi:hypothetical protein
MIEDLINNIKREKEIIQEIENIYEKTDFSKLDLDTKQFYLETILTLKNQIKLLNDSIPKILDGLVPFLVEEKADKEVVRLSYVSPSSMEKKIIVLNKKDKEKFIKELQLSEEKIGSIRSIKKEEIVVIKKQSNLVKLSNFFFLSLSEKLSYQFKDLVSDLKKANMQIMPATFISLMLFFSTLVFILSSSAFAVSVILYPSWMKWAFVPFLLFFLTFFLFYSYPSSQKGAFEKKISEELPFATIYMSAIASSDIEPTKIFKIIAMSSDYPAIGLEIRKLLNQVEIYGYDLVTALKNSAKATPNLRFSELLGGISTNILSGGSLKSYLETKSENFLMDYRLERQKYNALAETFMDIYISLLITAPMILVMLVIILNVTSMQLPFSFSFIMNASIGAVALINILFMVVLQMKQPRI